eukprot:TRINITY_DN114690_c0_g1_i1.p1 TRINITY_DN114690_c0_g1~~TRINITY_DN114690_c0_g1_i1.p1  ORF type:complete len:491 (+),score=72.17 TRINITY_DN114690_c0_g1_i1:136-1608(+)
MTCFRAVRLDGSEIAVDLPIDAKIGCWRALIAKGEGLPPAGISFLKSGQVLDDDTCLDGVDDGHCLVVAIDPLVIDNFQDLDATGLAELEDQLTREISRRWLVVKEVMECGLKEFITERDNLVKSSDCLAAEAGEVSRTVEALNFYSAEAGYASTEGASLKCKQMLRHCLRWSRNLRRKAFLHEVVVVPKANQRPAGLEGSEALWKAVVDRCASSLPALVHEDAIGSPPWRRICAAAVADVAMADVSEYLASLRSAELKGQTVLQIMRRCRSDWSSLVKGRREQTEKAVQHVQYLELLEERLSALEEELQERCTPLGVGGPAGGMTSGSGIESLGFSVYDYWRLRDMDCNCGGGGPFYRYDSSSGPHLLDEFLDALRRRPSEAQLRDAIQAFQRHCESDIAFGNDSQGTFDGREGNVGKGNWHARKQVQKRLRRNALLCCETSETERNAGVRRQTRLQRRAERVSKATAEAVIQRVLRANLMRRHLRDDL